MTRRDWLALGQAVALVFAGCVWLVAVLFVVDALEAHGALAWGWVVFALGVLGMVVGSVGAVAVISRRNQDHC